MFTAENFTHPGRGTARISFETALKNKFFDRDIVTKCYQVAQIPVPFMAHHDLCATALSTSKTLLDELQHDGFVILNEEPKVVESSDDFLFCLAHRLAVR